MLGTSVFRASIGLGPKSIAKTSRTLGTCPKCPSDNPPMSTIQPAVTRLISEQPDTIGRVEFVFQMATVDELCVVSNVGQEGRD